MPRFKKMKTTHFIRLQNIYLISWIISLSAFIISLIFSEIMQLAPCNLCWYQRIFMYPLVIILPIAYFNNDRQALYYTTPLTFIGFLISMYHVLLYHQIISEPLKLCSANLSCTNKQLILFNGIGIPDLSFIAFTILLILQTLGIKNEKRT